MHCLAMDVFMCVRCSAELLRWYPTLVFVYKHNQSFPILSIIGTCSCKVSHVSLVPWISAPSCSMHNLRISCRMGNFELKILWLFWYPYNTTEVLDLTQEKVYLGFISLILLVVAKVSPLIPRHLIHPRILSLPGDVPYLPLPISCRFPFILMDSNHSSLNFTHLTPVSDFPHYPSSPSNFISQFSFHEHSIPLFKWGLSIYSYALLHVQSP